MANAEIELEIDGGTRPGEYDIQVLRAAGGGETRSTCTLHIDAFGKQSRSLETAVLASAARARSAMVPELEKPLRQLGSHLFEALFSGSVATTYRASLIVARERGQSLRIVLRLAAPELAAKPWEALYDTEVDAYICQNEQLVRHIDAPFIPEPLTVQPPLRILGIVASPRGLPKLNVYAEKQHLEEALVERVSTGR